MRGIDLSGRPERGQTCSCERQQDSSVGQALHVNNGKTLNDKIRAADKEYDAANHAPILIYPNPLNPARYVVLNSGFTYRDYDYLNNARQVPKLPDWAIIDLRTPPNARWTGKVADAGFFDESWQFSNQ